MMSVGPNLPHCGMEDFLNISGRGTSPNIRFNFDFWDLFLFTRTKIGKTEEEEQGEEPKFFPVHGLCRTGFISCHPDEQIKEPGTTRGKEKVNPFAFRFMIKSERARYNSNYSEIYGTGERGGP